MIYGKCLVMFKLDLKVRWLRFPGKLLFLGHREAIQVVVKLENVTVDTEKSGVSLRQLDSPA